MDIKDIVKNNTARFAKYRQGVAYYAVRVPSPTLLATDKAMVFMRCIRKAIEDETFVKAN